MNVGQLAAGGLVAGACVLVPVTTLPEWWAGRTGEWRGLNPQEWQAVGEYVFMQYLWFAAVAGSLLAGYAVIA